jgi:hypothetical protein
VIRLGPDGVQESLHGEPKAGVRTIPPDIDGLTTAKRGSIDTVL